MIQPGKKYLLCLLTITLFFCTTIATAQTVSNYKLYFATAKYKGNDVLITRKFEQQGKLYYLTVDMNSLTTAKIAVLSITAIPTTWPQIITNYKNTPYIRALQRADQQSFSLQDAGIIHGYPKEKGVTLTIDLCPSHKPLDRVIFTSLVQEFKNIEKPVPVALSITGRFMLTHAADINWLKGLQQAGEISITWVNHTYDHRYDPKIPLKENFLLEPGTDVDFEVMGTEIAMLQHGLMPSVFFRFPGLVSDNAVVQKITSLGLIPVGSDAWLAKDQPALPGSIVLIHGNGNEPLGVKDFIKLLHTQKDSVMKHQWLLYDLGGSIEEEFR